VVEDLEERTVPAWIGAMSGTTNDAAHNYNNTANWALNTIDDSFALVNFTAATTLYLSANRTTGATGLNLSFTGGPLTLESNAVPPPTAGGSGPANPPYFLSLGGPVTVGAGTATIGDRVNPLELNLNGVTGAINMSGGNLTVVNSIINTVGGTAGLTETGPGTLTLQSESGFNGPTTINGGTVSIAGDGALGVVPAAVSAAAITLNSGTLSASNSFVLNSNRGITLNGTGTLDVAANQTLNYGGIITGGSLVETGAGILSLFGTNTYTGSTSINGGTLRLGASLPAVPAGFAVYYSYDSVVGSTVNNSGGTGATQKGTLTNAVIGAGMGLNGTNAMSIAVDGGGLVIASALSLGGGSWTASSWFSGLFAASDWRTLFRGATADHQLIVENGTTRLGTYNNGGGQFVPTGYDVNLGGIVNGWHMITEVGSGTTTSFYVDGVLVGVTPYKSVSDISSVGFCGVCLSQSYAHLIDESYLYQTALTPTQVEALYNATLYSTFMSSVGATNIIPDGSSVTVAAGATLDLNGNSETIGSLGGAGNVLLGAGTLTTGADGTSTTFSGVISGSGSVVKTGAGTFTFSGSGTYTGGTTVNAGSLTNSGTLPGNVTFNGGGTFTNNGTVTGNVTVSSGNLTNTGTIAGSATVSAGNTSGPGIFGGNLTLGASTLTPGPGTATFMVGGNLTLGSTSSVAIVLAGVGSNSQLAVTGAANLGNAALSLTNQFKSLAGTTFTIVTASGGLSGQFTLNGAVLTNGSFFSQGGNRFRINYTATGVTLTSLGATPPPPIFAVGADAGGVPLVSVYDGSGRLTFSFSPFPLFFKGGVRVAVGDVNGDGVSDLIVAAGPGGGPEVNIYDGRNYQLIRAFYALPSTFTGGLYVASGDVNGDGADDIIVGADKGGLDEVEAFDGRTGGLITAFFPFGQFATGGVRVAVGDVNGDGRADVIAGAGPGGLPQVTIYDAVTLNVFGSILAYPVFFTGGVWVAAGDVNSDGKADIITGAGAGGGPLINIFDGGTRNLLKAYYALPQSFTGGVRVAARDLNGDGQADIIAGAGPSGLAQVTAFDGVTLAVLESFFAYNPIFRGGIYVG
jgi:autotransporter-associated beta strand protein